MAPLTDTFMQITDESYTQIIARLPHLTTTLTRAQWQHCHRLLFARRVEDISFLYSGVKPPAPTRVPLPRPLRVFQPIWDILACMGITTWTETSTRYIPFHPLPNDKDPDKWSDEYITYLSTCQSFDWSDSWTEAQKGLQLEPDLPDGTPSTRDSNPLNPNTALSHVQRLWKETVAKKDSKLFRIKSNFFQSRTAQNQPWNNIWPLSSIKDTDTFDKKLVAQLMRIIKSEAQKWKPRSPDEIQPVKFNFDTPEDPGAYGAYLGWNPLLWLRYDEFVSSASQYCMFSLSMPNEEVGTMAWVLLHQRQQSQDFCKMPTRSIPTADWVLATLTKLSSWEREERTQYVSTWNVTSTRLGSWELIVIKWIRKAISSAPPTLPLHM